MCHTQGGSGAAAGGHCAAAGGCPRGTAPARPPGPPGPLPGKIRHAVIPIVCPSRARPLPERRTLNHPPGSESTAGTGATPWKGARQVGHSLPPRLRVPARARRGTDGACARRLAGRRMGRLGRGERGSAEPVQPGWGPKANRNPARLRHQTTKPPPPPPPPCLLSSSRTAIERASAVAAVSASRVRSCGTASAFHLHPPRSLQRFRLDISALFRPPFSPLAPPLAASRSLISPFCLSLLWAGGTLGGRGGSPHLKSRTASPQARWKKWGQIRRWASSMKTPDGAEGMLSRHTGHSAGAEGGGKEGRGPRR